MQRTVIRLRRWTPQLVAVLLVAALVAGCGLSNPLSAGIKKYEHDGARVTRHVSVLHAGLCAFHGWRLVTDLQRKHPAWTAYQAWRAAHACRRVRR